MKLNTEIKCGRSRKNVHDLSLSLEISKKDKNLFSISFKTDGYSQYENTIEEFGEFQSIVFGLAGLRQALRLLEADDPKLKFYENQGGTLNEITIEDVFWTHDCVSHEMEDMMEWARKKGYKPEE